VEKRYHHADGLPVELHLRTVRLVFHERAQDLEWTQDVRPAGDPRWADGQ
jgi:hypothetical protein